MTDDKLLYQAYSISHDWLKEEKLQINIPTEDSAKIKITENEWLLIQRALLTKSFFPSSDVENAIEIEKVLRNVIARVELYFKKGEFLQLQTVVAKIKNYLDEPGDFDSKRKVLANIFRQPFEDNLAKVDTFIRMTPKLIKIQNPRNISNQVVKDLVLRNRKKTNKNFRITETPKDVGIYWCTRPLDGWILPANHHFILVKWDENFISRDILPKDNENAWCTLAAFQENKRLHFKLNETKDFTHVQSDSFLQVQKVLPDIDINIFIKTILDLAFKYKANTKQERDAPKFDICNINCATWVYTLLTVAGITKNKLQELGEFWGIDWGEENQINESYFL